MGRETKPEIADRERSLQHKLVLSLKLIDCDMLNAATMKQLDWENPMLATAFSRNPSLYWHDGDQYREKKQSGMVMLVSLIPTAFSITERATRQDRFETHPRYKALRY